MLKISHKILLIVIANGVILTLISILWVSPAGARLTAYRQEEILLKNEFVEKRQQQINNHLIFVYSNSLQNKFSALLKKSQEKFTMNSVLSFTTEAIKNNHLQLQKIKITNPFTHALQIALCGNYADLLNFINALDNFPWLLQINKIHIQTNELFTNQIYLELWVGG